MINNNSNQLKRMQKSSIVCSINKAKEETRLTSHFGGTPDVPKGFIWPQYKDENLEEIYSIDFIVQFNCEELKKYDKENLLPSEGLISIFYDIEGQPHEGYSDDNGCLRVFFFSNIKELVLAEYPDDISEMQRLPYYSLNMGNKFTYPSYEDYELLFGKKKEDERNRTYLLLDNLHTSQQDEDLKVFGWGDVIQNSILADLKEKDTKISVEKQVLLLQANSIQNDDFELLFGDCGSIFMYMNKDDLLKCKFENVYLQLQS